MKFLKILILTTFTLSSNIIGQIKNDKVLYFVEKPKYLIFTFNDSMQLIRDNERCFPLSFEVRLPKGLKYWEIINSSDFGFYYSNKQVIFIKTFTFDLSYSDSIPTDPTPDELMNIIEKFYTSNRKRFNIKNYGIKKERVHKLILNNKYEILLFNIKKVNFDLFENSIRYFEQIKKNE